MLVYPFDDLLRGTAADKCRLHVRWKDGWSQRHADSGNGLQMAAGRHDVVSLRSPCGLSGRMHIGRRETENGSPRVQKTAKMEGEAGPPSQPRPRYGATA